MPFQLPNNCFENFAHFFKAFRTRSKFHQRKLLKESTSQSDKGLLCCTCDILVENLSCYIL